MFVVEDQLIRFIEYTETDNYYVNMSPSASFALPLKCPVRNEFSLHVGTIQATLLALARLE